MGLSAVIFDLDGVVTYTAHLHQTAWKKLFDNYLQEQAQKSQTPFIPFDGKHDYLKYVDGKPRYQGVNSFLKSRQITLPWGKVQDSPETETVCGLGNRKNQFFQKAIEENGVQVETNTVEWIETLKNQAIQVAMATSSKNAPLILKTAHLEDLFPIAVDGNDIEKLKLKGKPDPDLFLKAAELLKTPPQTCAIVEDALSGVEAGQRGHFGVVIGFRGNNTEQALLQHGADVVTQDLRSLNLSLLEEIRSRKIKSYD